MQIIWHGHSCVSIETKGKTIWIDPFITGNPRTDVNADKISCDYIVLTHGHGDHVGDAVAVSKRTNSPIIGMVELVHLLDKEGVETIDINLGGRIELPFGSIKFVPALHSSSYNSEYAGECAGVIFDIEGTKIYHMGDTALFSDLKLIQNIDYTFIPIGDKYTMGIEDALIASAWIDSAYFIPVHYNTFQAIEQDPNKYVSQLEKANGIVPKVGEDILTLTK